jgi:DNA-binding response OmpR family regulator
MLHGTEQTILLIEADASLRRLITLGLQYRGMHVIEASSPADLPPLEAPQPDLLVLDVDAGISSDWSLVTEAQSHPLLATLPIVVLAWDYPSPEGIQQATTSVQPCVTCLSKPFDARTLHATIEQLLATTTAQVVTPAKTEEMLLAAHAASPSASIWPLITAAGLLVAFIGLMVQITLTAIGILIVMVALLWWTLGTKKEQVHLSVASVEMMR